MILLGGVRLLLHKFMRLLYILRGFAPLKSGKKGADENPEASKNSVRNLTQSSFL